MQIIYETVNHWNRENGINPWRYIGSDEHNKISYLGSNKQLLEDIKILGKEFFEKKVLLFFSDDAGLTNVDLRNIESEIQKKRKCAEDQSYYNRTNSSHKGYLETEEEKEKRMLKCHKGHKEWFNSLSDVEKKELFSKQSGENNPMYGKKIYDVWLEKYGLEEAEKRKKSHKEKMSFILKGENNPRSKHSVFPEEKRKEAREKFKTGKYTHEDLAKNYGVSRRLIGSVVTNGIKIKRVKKVISIYENNILINEIKLGV